MKKLTHIGLLIICLNMTAQSDGVSPEQFSKELSVMTQDLTIANDCDNPRKLIVSVETLNMNFRSLELMNVELHVGKIINYGDIIYKCGSVVIEIPKNRKTQSPLKH